MERAWFEYEIIETKYFHRELEKLCNSEDEQNGLIEYVAKNRAYGVGIGKTGLKKIRVSLLGKGTRGGGRVIYYYTDEEDAFIFLMLLYSKSKKEDLNPEEEELLNKVLKKELDQRRSK